MEIVIIPDISTGVYEDDGDAALFEQGFDTDFLEIEDEESFEIPEGFHGRVSDPEEYELQIALGSGRWRTVDIEEDLQPGFYRLHENIIRCIRQY